MDDYERDFNTGNDYDETPDFRDVHNYDDAFGNYYGENDSPLGTGNQLDEENETLRGIVFENTEQERDVIAETQGDYSSGIMVGHRFSRIRKTPPYLTKYEKARVIGLRAKAIDDGAKILLDLDEYPHLKRLYDPVQIATNELYEGLLDMIIQRPLPNGTYEQWNLQELTILDP